MASTSLVREFERVRQELCRAGIPVHVPWSLSVADGSSMVITPVDPGVRPLTHTDLITTSLRYADGRSAEASRDADLHRAVYARGRHRAVLICRPPYAMTLGSMQPQLTCGNRSVPAIDCKELATHPRASCAVEMILLKGNALLAAGVDPASCLDLVVQLETKCAQKLSGVSRPG